MAGNTIDPTDKKIDEAFARIEQRKSWARQQRLKEAKTPEERRNLERRFQAEDERAKHPMMVIPE